MRCRYKGTPLLLDPAAANTSESSTQATPTGNVHIPASRNARVTPVLTTDAPATGTIHQSGRAAGPDRAWTITERLSAGQVMHDTSTRSAAIVRKPAPPRAATRIATPSRGTHASHRPSGETSPHFASR